MPKRDKFKPSLERILKMVTSAYPHRKHVVKDRGEYIQVVSGPDPRLKGSAPFMLDISDGRDAERQIERARSKAERTRGATWQEEP